jgi:hypothetical protein
MDAAALVPECAAGDDLSRPASPATSSSSDADSSASSVPEAPPAPAAPASEALEGEAASLVATLRGADARAQLAAARRVGELVAGERDKPANAAACDALLAAGAVPALRCPAVAAVAADEDAREAARGALRALAAFTNTHPPARFAVAADDSGWLPALCAVMHAEPPDEVAVDLALHVAWYTSRGGPQLTSSRRGAFDRYASEIGCICAVLCAGGVPAALVACLRRVVHEPCAPGANDKLPEGAAERVVYAATWCARNICLSSLPASQADDESATNVNGNATALYDSGAVPVLTALLARRPACALAEQTINALGYCVELNAERDSVSTLEAARACVALLSLELYGGAAAMAAAAGTDAGRAEAVVGAACNALYCICYSGEPGCAAVREAGGISALLALYRAEHFASRAQRAWFYDASQALQCALQRSAGCRDAFIAAGGFAAPAAALAAVPRSNDNAVSAATDLFQRDLFQRMSRLPTLRGELCASGAVRALCALVPSHPEEACIALWNCAEDSAAVAELVRDCGGIAAIAAVVRDLGADGKNAEADECKAVMGALMTLSTHDWLTAAIAEEALLEALSSIVRETSREDARLCALLAVSCVYAGRADAAAEALLADNDVTRHLVRMLQAVVNDPAKRLYLSCSWSAREASIYVRVAAVDAGGAARLAAMGAAPLLLQLLASTTDEAVQQHVCRALLNMSYVPSARAALQAAGAADAVASFAAAADALTASAAKGMVANLSEPAAAAVCSSTPPAAPHFRVFLSHKRSDAKDFARALHTFLKNEAISAFLDFEYKEELHDLDAVVSSCDNLVFILTDAVFASRWCRLELCAAVRAGVNVVLVRKEGAFWTCAATSNAGLTHPPPSLVDALALDEDVADATRALLLSRKSVEHSDVYYGAFTAELLQKLAPPDKAAAARRERAAKQQAAAPPPLTPARTMSSVRSVDAATTLPPAASHALSSAPPPSGQHKGAADAAAALQAEVLVLRRELEAVRSGVPPLPAPSGAAGAAPPQHTAALTALFATLGALTAVVAACCVAIVAIVASVASRSVDVVRTA